MKKTKVHILIPPEPEDLSALKEKLLPDLSITTGINLSPKPDYDILVAGLPDRHHLEASQKLHTLIIPFTGLPESTRALMGAFPQIAIHNLHHNATDTAEMALALLLAAAKYVIPFDQRLRAHDWSPRYRPSPAIRLRDSTTLILGFGHIGQSLGKICHAIGMKILAVRRHPERMQAIPFDAEIYEITALNELLPRVQVLMICLPLTSATENLIGSEEINLMPPGGILVNVSRGRIVNQTALYQALREHHLAAAGLDVWYNYPVAPNERTHKPPADFPFHELENAVLSPHRAGLTKETERERIKQLGDLLNTAALGLPLPNRVDLVAGY
jgi:phosphoglycerate dehydrogenase-like enzyme